MGSAEYREGAAISATELKRNLGKYLGLVEEHNEVVITKNGGKIARLTPYVTDLEQYFLARDRALDYQYGGKKVSCQEFMQIYEKSTQRMEFINGEIYLLASPDLGHQEILGRLHLIFNGYFQGNQCRVIFAPFDVHFRKREIKEPDVIQPDLLVACDLADNVTDKGRYMGTPALVLEILSDGTRSKDAIDKLNTYRLSGVREYWIVDPRQENIMVYSFQDCEIDKYRTFEGGDTAQSLAFPGLTVEIAGLFRELY